MYMAWCLTLYHSALYCWALSIYNYFNLIPMPLYHSHTLLSDIFIHVYISVYIWGVCSYKCRILVWNYRHLHDHRALQDGGRENINAPEYSNFHRNVNENKIKNLCLDKLRMCLLAKEIDANAAYTLNMSMVDLIVFAIVHEIGCFFRLARLVCFLSTIMWSNWSLSPGI